MSELLIGMLLGAVLTNAYWMRRLRRALHEGDEDGD